MVFRDENGSATIEGAIIFPLILVMVFGIMLIIFKGYNRFSIIHGLSGSLRRSAYSWYKEKKLYDDILYDFEDSKITKGKINELSSYYKYLEQPVFSHNKIGFSFSNLILYRSIKGISSSIELSYPVYRGSYYIRGKDYALELLEDAFSKLNENLNDDHTIYIVDDNLDEHEYDRVYHLYPDCSYTKKGYKNKLTLHEGRSMGFRVCRICLARKTGMD